MPEGTINNDINLGSQEHRTWAKGLYNNNSLGSTNSGKQDWRERRNEAGKEVGKNTKMTYWEDHSFAAEC